jgi:hypothetical protein
MRQNLETLRPTPASRLAWSRGATPARGREAERAPGSAGGGVVIGNSRTPASSYFLYAATNFGSNSLARSGWVFVNPESSRNFEISVAANERLV